MSHLSRLASPPLRFGAYALSLLGLAASLVGLSVAGGAWGWGVLCFGLLAALGTYDLCQRRHTVSRNYPILAHLRYNLESFGPEIRQYFIQSDTEEVPFSREQRRLIYQRAKNISDKRPFGSLHHMRHPGYEWISPSLAPTHIAPTSLRITVGAERTRPYSASVFNISAMSFGALSANAISALNDGACEGGFYHDTGEGAISPYHRRGGDLVWEIGSGYFGCRDSAGDFDPERFRENARDNAVRMIEIKLSQGAKPGHGGILPGAKVTGEIASTRGVPPGRDVISPAAHTAFTTPRELIDFIVRLRELAGDKPVGIKLAIGHPWEWFAIVKAMLETGEHPDFVVVDGGEGGTGAAPLEFINRLGMPLDEALLLVHNTLVGAGLRDRVNLAAAGKLVNAFDIARAMALGADWCNAARGFMFALGCIQARSCHTDRCPSGVATQDTLRGSRLDVPTKAHRVASFHANTVAALAEMLGAAGLRHASELGPEHISHRLTRHEVKSFAELHDFLTPGELLVGGAERHPVFRDYWESACADSFAPPEALARLRDSKLY
ncbi:MULTISPECIES: FMN-binding glutamate synthase family protein [unclassified Halomonas]|uniref:FMN-binding glutamate synthase family protein n=1 Tax=unclassified Halomonas TaxID=2609666 RepID=UPI0028862D0F|nr:MULTISPECIES: FMN-binding glutamate synthase family protein [unclassified Halomonas]MDT0501070.1 FMN-binding glutamate synthase family protein [Halomonas sp. PAR7]MDT0513261.1 FMN-binding glutamate synthase family protein [Halomonas sp. LES1]MDT0592227.1 FMN-binding glutamate synthase family protein [Halomonas sp. PAR8]